MWKSKVYGAFVLNRRVVLHAIDATPARWRGSAGSSPLDGASTAASSPRNDLVKNCRVHPTHFRFPHRSSVEVTDAALGEGADKVAQGVVDAAKRFDGSTTTFSIPLDETAGWRKDLCGNQPVRRGHLGQ